MTSSGDTGPRDVARQPLVAAEEDLAGVREVLESAARGQAGGDDLVEAVQGYLDEHGAALREAASALGEEARRQTLEELYKWRAQLDAQLNAKKRNLTSNDAPGDPPGQGGERVGRRTREQ